MHSRGGVLKIESPTQFPEVITKRDGLFGVQQDGPRNVAHCTRRLYWLPLLRAGIYVNW